MENLFSETATCFRHGWWDRYDYLGVLGASPKLWAEVKRQKKQYDYAIVQDAYYALMDLDKLPTLLAPAWDMVQTVPAFGRLMSLAADSHSGAVYATAAVARIFEHLLKQMGQGWGSVPPKPGGEKGDGGGAGEQGQGEGQEDGGGGSGKDEVPEAPGQRDPNNPVNRPLAKQPTAEDLEKLFNDAADKAEKKTKAQEALSSWLGNDPSNHPVDLAEELTEEFDLDQFVNMLGFAKRITAGANRMGVAPAGDMTGYRSGSWDDSVVIEDMLGVADGDLLALLRLADGDLRQTVYESDNPYGIGPVISIMDQSGSMRGDKIRRAKSLEVALAATFNGKGRDLVSIPFGAVLRGGFESFIYGEDGGLLQRHLREFLSGGSTRPEPAVRLALEIAETYTDGADLFVMTDGAMDFLSPETLKGLEAFRAKGGRVWGVLIEPDAASWQRSVAEGRMKWFDAWTHVDQLTTDKGIGDLIRQMAAGKDGETTEKML